MPRRAEHPGKLGDYGWVGVSEVALQGHVGIREAWFPMGSQASNLCLISHAPIKPEQEEGGFCLTGGRLRSSARTVQLFECSPSAPSICLYV